LFAFQQRKSASAYTGTALRIGEIVPAQQAVNNPAP
jgi:hypothetical protein